jgi:hypothetical protein
MKLAISQGYSSFPRKRRAVRGNSATTFGLRGLDPRIHVFDARVEKSWMAGSSPRLSGSAKPVVHDERKAIAGTPCAGSTRVSASCAWVAERTDKTWMAGSRPATGTGDCFFLRHQCTIAAGRGTRQPWVKPGQDDLSWFDIRAKPGTDASGIFPGQPCDSGNPGPHGFSGCAGPLLGLDPGISRG